MKHLLTCLTLLMVASISLFIPVGSVFAAAHDNSPDGTHSSPLGSRAGDSPGATHSSPIGSRATESRQETSGCQNMTCYGLDPGRTGCNLSTMTSAAYLSVSDGKQVLATGQVIHSVGCNADWAEGTLTTPPGAGYTLSVYISGGGYFSCFPEGSSGGCSSYGYAGSTGWPAFTNMVSTNYTLACIVVDDPARNVFASSPFCTPPIALPSNA